MCTRLRKKGLEVPQKQFALCQLQIGTYQEHCQRLNNKGICHLPLVEIELGAAIAVDLQQPLREFRVE